MSELELSEQAFKVPPDLLCKQKHLQKRNKSLRQSACLMRGPGLTSGIPLLIEGPCKQEDLAFVLLSWSQGRPNQPQATIAYSTITRRQDPMQGAALAGVMKQKPCLGDRFQRPFTLIHVSC